MFRQTRQVIRGLLKSRSFTAASVLTLALASGATAAILAVVHGILAAPLPFRQPDRLVAVWPRQFQSNADLIYQREHAHMFAGLAAVAPGWNMSLYDVGEPAKVTVARTSGNLFDVLGAGAALGRTFSDADGSPGSAPVAVLSHGLWRQRFGGDPGAIGRAVGLDDLRVTIIGVMPPTFEVLGLKTDIYTPLTLDSSAWYHTMAFSLYLGRLNDGFSLDGASRDYRAMLDELRRERGYPGDYGRTARLQDLRESVVGNARQALLILAATAVAIMLIAAVNVGTLFLTRTTGRRRALAIRTALGASRKRIAGELLLESAAIAVAGAALGVLLAAVLLPALLAMLPPDTPRLAEIRFDVRVTMAVLAGAAGLSVLFGAVPVAAARQFESSALLRATSQSESIGTKRTRAVMVSAEIALAVVLLTSAGLMIQTLTRLLRVAPGFAAEGVLTLHVQPTGARYKSMSPAAYYDSLLARLRAVPGVTAAGAIQHLPFSGYSWTMPIEIEGRAAPRDTTPPLVGNRIVTAGYFDAIGQPLLAGRAIEPADSRGSAVVVNEAFAVTHHGSIQRALGRRIRPARGRPAEWMTIIGVVGNVRHTALTTDPVPEVYSPVTSTSIPVMMVAIKAAGEPQTLVAAVRAAIRSEDPHVPVADVQPMQERIDRSLGQPRLLVMLLSAFALVAIGLAALGIYGVVSHSAARRQREIGIKIALGSGRGRVVREVMMEGVLCSVAGLTLGIPAAAVAARLMEHVLYGVTPADPAAYAVTAITTLGIAACACLQPALKASGADPLRAIRE